MSKRTGTLSPSSHDSVERLLRQVDRHVVEELLRRQEARRKIFEQHELSAGSLRVGTTAGKTIG
jgi:hypothetical protein